ncbi:unnamed protein product [Mytilus coruscus]|uniref:Uncharacterized protein n=1 Tax=Mytilus coruscus TaxID=42192 RepID=A0A6J8DV84_MYTCO|nr:unnamed protein product [Mytilus coruscus]
MKNNRTRKPPAYLKDFILSTFEIQNEFALVPEVADISSEHVVHRQTSTPKSDKASASVRPKIPTSTNIVNELDKTIEELSIQNKILERDLLAKQHALLVAKKTSVLVVIKLSSMNWSIAQLNSENIPDSARPISSPLTQENYRIHIKKNEISKHRRLAYVMDTAATEDAPTWTSDFVENLQKDRCREVLKITKHQNKQCPQTERQMQGSIEDDQRATQDRNTKPIRSNQHNASAYRHGHKDN